MYGETDAKQLKVCEQGRCRVARRPGAEGTGPRGAAERVRAVAEHVQQRARLRTPARATEVNFWARCHLS